MKFLRKNKNKNVKITYFPKDSSYLNAVKNAGSSYCRLCQVAYNPHGTVSNIKREMGTGRRIEAFGKKFTPQFISALFLMKIKVDAEAFLNEKITKAVIAIPANFNDIQRQATMDAGQIAGP